MTNPEETMKWKEAFKKFYDTNESGGSSRWLVAPNIVELFIRSLLAETRKEERKNYYNYCHCKKPNRIYDKNECNNCGKPIASLSSEQKGIRV
jgi:hypothetical protein